MKLKTLILRTLIQMGFFIKEHWFKISILLFLLVITALGSFYIFIFKPRLDQESKLKISQISAPLSEDNIKIKTNSGTTNSNNHVLSASQALKNSEEGKELSPMILKNVMARMVLVKCYGAGASVAGSGSAGLISSNDPIVVTNFHVPGSAGGISSTCTINIPESPDYSPGNLFSAKLGLFDSHYSDANPENDIDVAVLHIQNVTDGYLSIFGPFPIPFCDESKIEIGDQVTVLGYPAFGDNISTGAQSLTVTNGIISGLTKTPYGVTYKTSAAFDHGVSGGLAILNKNACVIGIPTWINYGSSINLGIGSTLGLIQSWSSIKNSGEILKISSTPSLTQQEETTPSTPTQSPVQQQTTPAQDETIAEDYYRNNKTCTGLYGTQYDDCVTYAYNH